MRRYGLPLLVYAAVAVALSWPLVLDLEGQVLGDAEHPGSRGDIFFQYNVQQQMQQGRFPSLVHTDLLRHPEGMDIDARVAFSAHHTFYALLMTFLGLMASRNLTALLLLVLDAFAMHLLARERTGRESFAYLGGLLFGFGSYAFLKVQQGFFQKVCLFAIPLFVLYLLRALEDGRRRDQALCTLWLGVSLVLYPPYAVFNVLFGAVLGLGHGISTGKLKQQLKRFAPAVGGIAAIFAAVAAVIRTDPRPVSMREDMALHSFQILGGYLDPLSPFRWFPYESTFFQPPCDLIPTLPLGFPILLTGLAGVGVVLGARHARWLGLAAAGMLVLMLGPYLLVSGSPGDPDATAILLPFYFLGSLPMGSVLKFPIRLYPWVLIAMLLAAGGGLALLEERLKRTARAARWAVVLFPAVLAASVVENRLVFPEYARFVVTEPRLPSFYSEIEEETFDALLLLPEEPRVPNDHVYVAALTGRPLVNGYLEQTMPVEVPGPGATSDERDAFVAWLVQHGVRYVVVDFELLDRGYIERVHPLAPGTVAPGGPASLRWLDERCGLPRVWPEDRLVVYEVFSGPPDPSGGGVVHG